MEHISVTETQALLEDRPDLVLLDCREAEELAVASIAGARHIPMSEIPGRLEELDPEAETIVFCHHGIRSQSVATYLEQHGFARVDSMVGGIDAWSCEIDPEVPRY